MKTLLLDQFYSEVSSTFSPETKHNFTSFIRLNPAHPVYKGHFGEIPVAPGVCLVQIIKEILINKLNRDMILLNGDNIKFLSPINPAETPELAIQFQTKGTESGMDVSATYNAKGTSFVKFKGKFAFGNPADFRP